MSVSADGISWKSRRLPASTGIVPSAPILLGVDGDLYAFAAQDGRFVGWRSADGRKWTSLEIGAGIPKPDRLDLVDAAVARDGSLVVLGGVRTVEHSIGCESEGPCPDTTLAWIHDGSGWSAGPVQDASGALLVDVEGRPMRLSGIWAMGEEVAALGPGRTLLTSPDGVRWTVAGTVPPDAGEIVAVGYRELDHATYVVGGPDDSDIEPDPDRSVRVLRSGDLSAWEVVHRSPDRWHAFAADIAEPGIAIGGRTDIDAPWMASSRDGTTWATDVGLELGCTDDVAAGATSIVAVGGSCLEGPMLWVWDR